MKTTQNPSNGATELMRVHKGIGDCARNATKMQVICQEYGLGNIYLCLQGIELGPSRKCSTNEHPPAQRIPEVINVGGCGPITEQSFTPILRAMKN
jgi:hypothetical protein